MRLTQRTDYSVRVLIYLSVNPERTVTVAEIAKQYGISRHHLTKVAHELGKAGYLATTRGRSGGIRLAKAPRDINVGDVVRLMEMPSVLVECFQESKGNCAIVPACKFKHVLAEAQEAFLSYLDQFTLATITENASSLRALLDAD